MLPSAAQCLEDRNLIDPAIRVVIAEDQSMLRRGTALLIAMAPDLERVGHAFNGEEAVQLVLLLRPDVVLIDFNMPVKGGVTATRKITMAQPSTQALVLTILDDDETVFEAIRAGAQAYLLKDVSEEELPETIRGLRLNLQITRQVMDQFRGLESKSPKRRPDEPPPDIRQEPAIIAHGRAAQHEVLSGKEDAVLEVITEGSSNRQIALALSLAEGTTKNYVSLIMDQLHANTALNWRLLPAADVTMSSDNTRNRTRRHRMRRFQDGPQSLPVLPFGGPVSRHQR